MERETWMNVGKIADHIIRRVGSKRAALVEQRGQRFEKRQEAGPDGMGAKVGPASVPTRGGEAAHAATPMPG